MGDVTCTYADNPSDACGDGTLVTLLRVMQHRTAYARQGPSGSAAIASEGGSLGASWPRYGSGSLARTPAQAEARPAKCGCVDGRQLGGSLP
eukprot:85025-Chlamydomonas_euryale.AAC.2